jgi:hypothetical protein
VLLSTLLQDILNSFHHLLNVLLQIANKLGLPAKKNTVFPIGLAQCPKFRPPWNYIHKANRMAVSSAGLRPKSDCSGKAQK